MKDSTRWPRFDARDAVGGLVRSRAALGASVPAGRRRIVIDRVALHRRRRCNDGRLSHRGGRRHCRGSWHRRDPRWRETPGHRARGCAAAFTRLRCNGCRRRRVEAPVVPERERERQNKRRETA